jgi:preprotein translocase subunit SecE
LWVRFLPGLPGKTTPSVEAAFYTQQKECRVTEKVKDIQVKKPNAIRRWWKETIGELRKVTWPTLLEARRLTVIVLAVMIATAILLGTLDYVFSRVITAILA